MEGLRIKGTLHYVSDFHDFLDLVREYMGDDAHDYLEKKHQEKEYHKELFTDTNWEDLN